MGRPRLADRHRSRPPAKTPPVVPEPADRRRWAAVRVQSTLLRNALVRSCCGFAITSRGVARLDDHAAVHEDQRVADLAGEADLVGHHDHRHARRGPGPASRRAPRRPVPGRARRSARRRASASAPWPARGRSPPAAAGRRTAAPGTRRACRRGRPAPAAPRARSRTSRLRLRRTCTGASMTLLQRRHVREEVEPLEHHADRRGAARRPPARAARAACRRARGSRPARRRRGSGRR